MKKTLLLWAAVSLCGCSVRRAATLSGHTDTRRDTTSAMQTTTQTSRTVRQTTASDCVTTVTTDHFDTSRPVDPQTGTPPVARRTTVRTHRTDTVSAVAEQTAAVAQTQTRSASESDQSRIDASQQVERRAGAPIVFWSIIVLLAALIRVVWRQLKQRINPF